MLAADAGDAVGPSQPTEQLTASLFGGILTAQGAEIHMPTPKKPAKKDGIESVPTGDLVRSLRKDLDVEAEKRRKEWEEKQAAKKSKK
jgi:hypothetical protein